MAKRSATSELNHDNWNEEEEPEEAGTFVPADTDTIKGRIIKKAKRRGIAPPDSKSVFAGFGGFSGAPAAPASSSFSFLASAAAPKKGKESSNGSNPPTGFTFATPPSTTGVDSNPPKSGFCFGSDTAAGTGFVFGTTSTTKSSSDFSFGNGTSSTSSSKTSGFSFGVEKSEKSDKKPFVFGAAADTCKKSPSDEAEKAFVFGAPKEDKKEQVEKPTLSDMFKPKVGSWACSVCDVRNDADKANCLACQTAKPTTKKEQPSLADMFKPKAGSWTCSVCDVRNDADKAKCLACETPNPASSSADKKPSLSEMFKPKSGSWKCSVCDVSNDADKNACAACTTPKPGASTTTKPSSTPFGAITTSGFKFASSSSAAENSGSGFKFGSGPSPVVSASEEKKTPNKEYLSHLKALNTQVTSWIKTHVDKNPYVLLTPVFRDYDKHLKEINDKYRDGGEKTKEAAAPTGFTFGSSSSKTEKEDKPLLGAVFGTKSSPPETEAVKFGSTKSPTAEAVKFPTCTTSSSQPSFSFGSANTEGSKTGFSFGLASKTDDKKPPTTSGFSFGSAITPSTTSFGSSTFGSVAPSSESSNADSKDVNEEDEPPKVEVTQVVEENSLYSVRCKLFYKKGKEFVEKGLGMLHLKSVEGSDKTQMVVRAETNLGNILLNIIVNNQMSLMKRKNNLQFVCIPNPPIPGVDDGPVSMLIKVKDALMADELEAKLKEYIPEAS